MDKIFENIILSFNSLWSYKLHKNTLEVITPYTTASNSKFISVFVTKQNGNWIVTDGGWINRGIYGIDGSYVNGGANDLTKMLLSQYQQIYSIDTVHSKGLVFFYKKTKEHMLIPNLIYDIGNFVSKLTEGIYIGLANEKEKEITQRFSSRASDFIKDIYGDKNIRRNAPIEDQFKAARFSAIVVLNPSSLLLIDYITGSTPYYFGRNISNFSMNYDIASHSRTMDYVKQKIAFIDDNSDGFKNEDWSAHIDVLKQKSIDSIKWSDRESSFLTASS